MPKLTKRVVDSLTAGDRDQFAWCSEMRGFGVRVLPTGVKSFFVQYRNAGGRSRRMTIGRYGVLTVDQARDKAREILVQVSKGEDAASERAALREAPTMSDLFDRYLKEHVRIHNSERTAADVAAIVERRLRPALGARKVDDVDKADLERLQRSMAATPRAANLSLAYLSKAFTLAIGWGMRADGQNPCRLVKRFAEGHRERFLSLEELEVVGKVMIEAETTGLAWRVDRSKASAKHIPKAPRLTPIDPVALRVLRVLLLTGARLSEIVELEWQHVDQEAGTLSLPAIKGRGRRPHPAASAVFGLLGDRPKGAAARWVFPRTRDPERHISKEVIENAWQRLRVHAGVPDVTIHDFRHTVGTYASNSGVNAFIVRDLLRHQGVAMTARYVNRSKGPVQEIAEAIGETIAERLGGIASPARIDREDGA